MASIFTLFSAVFLLFQYTSAQCLPSLCNGQGIDYQQNIEILLPSQQNIGGGLSQFNSGSGLGSGINIGGSSCASQSIGLPNYSTQSIGIPNYSTQSIGIPNYSTQSIGVPSLSGSSFRVLSYGPNIPAGLSVISESELLGNVQITGALPFATSVIVDGNVANGGSGSINYGCGSNVNLETAGLGYGQQSGSLLAASLPGGIGVNGGGFGQSLPIGLGGNIGQGCSCGIW